MTRQQLLDNLQKVQHIANANKWHRFLNNPYKYVYAIVHRICIYAITQNEKLLQTPTFFGQALHIALPASTDIYLTKGKSHASEINLAQYLINNLQANNCFIDIGAHCGYFTTLAAKLVTQNGMVIAMEPSNKTFSLLQKNVHDSANIIALQLAVSNNCKPITFYEFPSQYGEYNTINMEQFKNANWIKKWKPKAVEINCITLDTLCLQYNCVPNIIKIDVEGAENLVIEGALQILKNNAPTIVMEYVAAHRSNANHQLAAQMLHNLNYKPHIILQDASLQKVQNIDTYFTQNNLESDNIVFVKTKNL